MARKTYLEPYRMLVIDASNNYSISFIVVNSVASVLHMESVVEVSDHYYFTRMNVISVIDRLIDEYNVDTILMEKNKLLTDKMDKYPDYSVLQNVIFKFGLQVSIEDKYYNSKVILLIPEYEWKKSIFGKWNHYAIDLYKAHVLKRSSIPIKYLIDIEKNNYYKAICLSESILYGDLMHTKYQMNKGVL